MKASKYQEAIYEWVKEGEGNCVIEAIAGSGKTTVLKDIVKIIPDNKRVLMIAFNKSIVDELQRKIQLPNTKIMTSHGLGFSMLKQHFKFQTHTPKLNVDEYKYRNYVKKNFADLTMGIEFADKTEAEEFKQTLLSLVDMCRLYLCETLSEIESIASKYNYIVSGDHVRIIKNVINWGKDELVTIDFTDMVSLPNYFNIIINSFKYDWVLIDEAQDSSLAVQKLFQRCIKKEGRFIAVGDSAQCQPAGTKILMFDGTEKNIENIKIGDKVTVCSLSHSLFLGYKPKINRGGFLVTNVANRIVSKTIKIKTDNNKICEYTSDHICYAKFSSNLLSETTYVLYLMCNDNGKWRIGVTTLYRKNFNHDKGFVCRLVHETCHKLWILQMYNDKTKCEMDEVIYSLYFQIPSIIFRNTKYNLNDLYNNLDLLTEYYIEDRVNKCLEYFNKDINYPFHERNNTADYKNKKHLFPIRACNLFAEYMDVAIFDDKNKKLYRTNSDKMIVFIAYEKITKIEINHEEKMVYSIEVDKYHNYVANKILTHNCIQTFAGSDNEAFKKIKELPNTITLPLSLNYRCPLFIENMVKKIVDNFETSNKERPGVFKTNVLVKDIKDNSMVICRKTQPLIKLYLELLKSNRKCYIKGFDIGGSIIEIIEKLDMPYISSNFQRDGIVPKLYKELLDYRAITMKKYKIDIYDASNESTFQRKLEIINTISALSENIDNTYELIARCKKIFNQTNEGICLITNHKAKGLENDVVYHLCPSLLPDPRAKKDWEIQTERNLEYVLYTRTKNEFYTISEEDFPPPKGSKDVKELVSYLNEIEHKLKILSLGISTEQPKQKSTVEKTIETKTDSSVIPIIETDSSNDYIRAQTYLTDKAMKKKMEEQNAIEKFERIMVGKTIAECYVIFNDFGISSDIRILTVDGKKVGKPEKGKKDTINVDVNNIFDQMVKKIIRIGK